jgi:hypothetical protein
MRAAVVKSMIDDAKAAKLQRLNGAMDFITKHFAVLSVALAVFGMTTAIIFIAAYLRVFDWRIIWIIEYADVLKIGLITVALFSGFSYYIWSGARDAIDLATQRGRSWVWIHLFGVALWCLSLGSVLYTDYHSPEPHYAMHIWAHLAIFAVIGLWLVPMNVIRDFPDLNAKQVAWIIFVIVSNVSTLGTAFGYYTRDTEGFVHDVFLRDAELHDVGLVMITSHHVVLYTKEQTVIVVPAGDVTKIERKK